MKIKLPPFVLADLYKNSLVITDAVSELQPAVNETDTENTTFFWGNNNKQIAVLVNDANKRFTDDESLHLLTNMLAALHMNAEDIALINVDKTNIDYKEMQATLETRVCILFDVPTQRIGLPFQMPGYKVQAFNNCKFLCSASLHKMKGNSKEAKLEKTKLWMCLKTIFE